MRQAGPASELYRRWPYGRRFLAGSRWRASRSGPKIDADRPRHHQKTPMDQQTRERIRSTIQNNAVVLFMKGTPDAPRCGFSATVVQILDTLGAKYASVDVLSDPHVRDGIKEYSDWPTIPQLYVKNEFVGGCDIIKELYGSGELEEKLGVQAATAVEPPRITVTERAAKALKAAIESDNEGVRFEIDARYAYSLSIGERNA